MKSSRHQKIEISNGNGLSVIAVTILVCYYVYCVSLLHNVFNHSDLPEFYRHALVFGSQKINLHQAGREFEPKAQNVQPGSGDLCFLTDTPMDQVLGTFQEQDMEVRLFHSSRYEIESYSD